MKDIRIKGFTLLEVMVSIGILGFIMTLVWSGSSQSRRAKQRVDIRSEVYHKGAVALRKISDDVSMSFLAVRSKAQKTGADATTPNTTEAEAVKPTDTIKTFFIAADNGDKDSLKFTSFSHMRLFKNAKESDQCKIQYEIVASEEEGGGFDLIRREEAWLDGSMEIKASPLVLAGGIKSFNIEYYDEKKDDWRGDWDTEKPDAAGKLPKAARIKLSFDDPFDEKSQIDFSTAVGLPLSGSVIEY